MASGASVQAAAVRRRSDKQTGMRKQKRGCKAFALQPLFVLLKTAQFYRNLIVERTLRQR